MRLLKPILILSLASTLAFGQRGGGGRGGGSGGGGWSGGGGMMGGGGFRGGGGWSGGGGWNGGGWNGGSWTGGGWNGGGWNGGSWNGGGWNGGGWNGGGWNGGGWNGGWRGNGGFRNSTVFTGGWGWPGWGWGWSGWGGGWPLYSGGYYGGCDPYGGCPGGYVDPGAVGYAQQPLVAYGQTGPPPVVVNQSFGATDAAPRQPGQPVASFYGPTGYGPTDYYLIAFNDHMIRAAVNYHVEADTIVWTTREGQTMNAPLSSVDVRFSQQINRDRRVDFRLP